MDYHMRAVLAGSGRHAGHFSSSNRYYAERKQAKRNGCTLPFKSVRWRVDPGMAASDRSDHFGERNDSKHCFSIRDCLEFTAASVHML